MCRKSTRLASVILMLGVSVGITNADIQSDLISHWRMDDGSGTTAKDGAGVNDGTLKGDATWADGWIVGAVLLDGDDDYVDCGQGTAFNSVCRDAVTLAAWIKTDPDAGSTWGGIIFRGHGEQFGNTPPNDTFAYYFNWSTNALGFKTSGTSGNEWFPTATDAASDVVDGEWHHTAAVYNGVDKIIYLDAVEIGRMATTGQISSGLGTGRIIIGGGRDIDPMLLEFQGLIDDARIYDRALTQEEVVAVMENIESYPYASGPKPPVGTIHPDTWVKLSWRAGDSAVSHDVYLGDSFDDVNNATSETFIGNQTELSILAGFPGYPVPDGLVPGTTYYWRIDEVNDLDPNSPWRGDIWSFSIPPKTAYSPDPRDGAEFVAPNTAFSWTGGFGAMLHTTYIGNSFEDVNSASGGALMGAATFTPTLEPEKVYYWRVDEFDSFDTHKGDIWAFTTPGAVGNPQPANGAVDASLTSTLTWTSADNAASHELYFGTDRDAVNNATTASPEYVGPRALCAESHDSGKLDWHARYYWRVDEVYPAETIKGLVWSFETADFIVVDDFESYNDIEEGQPDSNRIYLTWIDGFGTTTNGAVAGNLDVPLMVPGRNSAQAMPLSYDNAGKTSEVTRSTGLPADWTASGVTKLSLWFRGASGNAADRMFVALGSAVVYHPDDAATQDTGWNEWVIDLQEFANQGANLANVTSITLGFGTRNAPVATGGIGTVEFDDIGLRQ